MKTARRVMSIVFMLALVLGLVGSISAPQFDAHALTVLTITNSDPVGSWFGNFWGAPQHEEWSCAPWQSGFTCHWKVFRLAGEGGMAWQHNVTFSDSRGVDAQQYYYFIEGYADGVGYANSYGAPFASLLGEGQVFSDQVDNGNGYEGNGYHMKIGSPISTGRNLNVGLAVQANATQSDTFDVTIYVTSQSDEVPFEVIHANFYLDDNEWANQSSWTAQRLQPYINEVNMALDGTNKRMEVGTIQYANSEPFNSSILGCLYTLTQDVKIWVSDDSGVEIADASGMSHGVDCDGFGTIVLYEGGNNNPNAMTSGILPNYFVDRDAMWSQTNYDQVWDFIRTIEHEYVHTMGGFSIEAYTFQHVTDSASQSLPYLSPDMTINVDNGVNDKYWMGAYGHGDLYADVMANNVRRTGVLHNFADERHFTSYSQLSKDFINGGLRGQLHIGPFFTTIIVNDWLSAFDTPLGGGELNVQQVDEYGNPAPGVTIYAYMMSAPNNLLFRDILVGIFVTDENGWVHIPWYIPSCNNTIVGGMLHPADQCAAMSLRSYKDEQPYGEETIVDVYDLQLAAFNFGDAITDYDVHLGRSGTHTMTFNATTQTGWVRSTGSICAGNCLIKAGDLTDKSTYRGILQFNTDALPDNATVTNLRLDLTASGWIGSVAGFGSTNYPNDITLFRGSPCIGTCGIQASDYSASLGQVGHFTATPGNEPYSFSWNLASQWVNLTGPSEFRLQWSKATDNDSVADQVMFVGAGGATPPVLTVTYTLP